MFVFIFANLASTDGDSDFDNDNTAMVSTGLPGDSGAIRLAASCNPKISILRLASGLVGDGAKELLFTGAFRDGFTGVK